MKDIEKLLPFCKTSVQEKYVHAVIKYGSVTCAAKAMNAHRTSVGNAITRIKENARAQGFEIIEKENPKAAEKSSMSALEKQFLLGVVA